MRQPVTGLLLLVPCHQDSWKVGADTVDDQDCFNSVNNLQLHVHCFMGTGYLFIFVCIWTLGHNLKKCGLVIFCKWWKLIDMVYKHCHVYYRCWLHRKHFSLSTDPFRHKLSYWVLLPGFPLLFTDCYHWPDSEIWSECWCLLPHPEDQHWRRPLSEITGQLPIWHHPDVHIKPNLCIRVSKKVLCLLHLLRNFD